MRTTMLATAVALLASTIAPRSAAAEDDAPPPPESAVVAERPSITFGPRIAANVADLSGDASIAAGSAAIDPTFAATTGAAGGGFVAIAINDIVAVQIEALIDFRGAVAEGSVPDAPMGAPPFNVEYRMLYVDVPVLGRFDIAYDGRFTPRVYAGAAFGFAVSSKIEGRAALDDGMGGFTMFDAEIDLDDVEPFHVAAVAGVGVGFPLPRGSLVLDVRFQQGITKAIDSDTSMADGIEVTTTDVRHRLFAIGLAWEIL